MYSSLFVCPVKLRLVELGQCSCWKELFFLRRSCIENSVKCLKDCTQRAEVFTKRCDVLTIETERELTQHNSLFSTDIYIYMNFHVFMRVRNMCQLGLCFVFQIKQENMLIKQECLYSIMDFRKLHFSQLRHSLNYFFTCSE